MKITLVLLLTIFLTQPVYADFTTGMVVGLAAGNMMGDESSPKISITDAPDKIITLREGCWSNECEYKKAKEFVCPNNGIKKILWRDNYPDKILCFRRK